MDSRRQMRILGTKRPFTPREKPSWAGGRLSQGGSEIRNQAWTELYSDKKLPQVSESGESASITRVDEPAGSHVARRGSMQSGFKGLKLPAISVNEHLIRKQFRSIQVNSNTNLNNNKSNNNNNKAVAKTGKRLESDLLELKRATERNEAEEMEKLLKSIKVLLSRQSLDQETGQKVIDATLPLLQDDRDHLVIAALDVIMTFRKTPSLFDIIAKVFVHLSKSDENDGKLLDSGILDKFVVVLGDCSPVKHQEHMLLIYGGLKFLSYNPIVLDRLHSLGIMDLMLLHLKILCSENISGSDDVIFQILSCLRNAFNVDAGRKAFAKLSGQEILNSVASRHLDNVEIMCNMSRIYSVLSMVTLEENLDVGISTPGNLSILLQMLAEHPGKPDLVVRCAFALGNLAAISDSLRASMMSVCPSKASTSEKIYALKLLPDVLTRYLNDIELEVMESDEIRSEKKEDCAIKIIRIFANLSLTEDVGKKIATEQTIIDLLLRILKLQEDSPVLKHLLLPSLSTASNLSYYPILFHIDLYQHISKFLFSANSDVAVECSRVLGNLTRRRDVRLKMMENFDWNSLLRDLEITDEVNFIFSSIGVLVNMMINSSFKIIFLENRGLEVSLTLLQNSSSLDQWSISSLICQLLWNFFNDISDLENNINPEQIKRLKELLIDLVDGDDQDDYQPLTEADQEKQEFTVVVLTLLNKVFSLHDELY